MNQQEWIYQAENALKYLTNGPKTLHAGKHIDLVNLGSPPSNDQSSSTRFFTTIIRATNPEDKSVTFTVAKPLKVELAKAAKNGPGAGPTIWHRVNFEFII